MRKSNKFNSGDPALRKALLNEVKELVPVEGLTEAELNQMDKDIFKTCTVAQRYANQIVRDQIHGLARVTGGIDSHQKMKIAQDYIAGTFLHPEMRKALLRKALEDPIALAKLMVAIMPKELNVKVEERKGVILVPMRMENVEDWEKKALAGMNPDAIEGEAEPRVQSWDDIVAEGDTA